MATKPNNIAQACINCVDEESHCIQEPQKDCALTLDTDDMQWIKENNQYYTDYLNDLSLEEYTHLLKYSMDHVVPIILTAKRIAASRRCPSSVMACIDHAFIAAAYKAIHGEQWES